MSTPEHEKDFPIGRPTSDDYRAVDEAVDREDITKSWIYFVDFKQDAKPSTPVKIRLGVTERILNVEHFRTLDVDIVVNRIWIHGTAVSHYVRFGPQEKYPPTCILTGAPGEDPDDCTTHAHE